jgi:hypothetical protein
LSAIYQEVAVSKVWATLCLVVLIAQMAAAQKKTLIVGSWIAAWNSHDAEKVIAIFTSDVLFEDVTFGAANHGSSELASSLHLSLMPYQMRNLSW